MVTIIQGPRTYMETLLRYINNRIEYLQSTCNDLEAVELMILRNKIESGDFEEKPNKTITPPKVVL